MIRYLSTSFLLACEELSSLSLVFILAYFFWKVNSFVKIFYADNAIIGNAKKSIEEIKKKGITFYGIWKILLGRILGFGKMIEVGNLVFHFFT